MHSRTVFDCVCLPKSRCHFVRTVFQRIDSVFHVPDVLCGSLVALAAGAEDVVLPIPNSGSIPSWALIKRQRLRNPSKLPEGRAVQLGTLWKAGKHGASLRNGVNEFVRNVC